MTMIPKGIDMDNLRRWDERPVAHNYSVLSATNLTAELIAEGDGHLHVDAIMRRTPLYEMADSHLLNTIAFHARNLATIIKKSSILNVNNSMLGAVMSGKTSVEEKMEEMKDAIAGGYGILGRYMVEATRRGGGIIKLAVEECMVYTDVLNELSKLDVKGNVVGRIEGGSDEEK